MESSKQQFGQRIKKYRKACGMSQEQLAEAIGVDQKHVSRIEVGKSYPTIDRLEKIAQALQVPMGGFFDDAGQAADRQKAVRLERMVSELDADYQHIILKFSQILKEFKDV